MRQDVVTAPHAYQTGDDPPTLTFRGSNATIALPYHLLHALRLGERDILMVYSGYEITVHGQALGKLWIELCAYRVKEIVVTSAGGAAGPAVGTTVCRVEGIEIVSKELET